MTILPTKSLGRTAVQVSVLGYGAASLGNLYRTQTDEGAAASVQAALAAGITYFDTAPRYGHGMSERRLGASLPADAVISTKVGRILTPIDPPPPNTTRHGFVDGDPFEEHFDYSYDGIMRSFEASLKRLKRERIDILLAHDIGRLTHAEAHDTLFAQFLTGGLKAMQALKAQGLVQAIGLGVNEAGVCNEVLDHADMDAFLLAGRYTLLEQGPLDQFLPRCVERGASIILGGPFNSGILIDGVRDGAPPPMYDYAPAPAPVVARVKALQTVCAAHGVPLAAAAMQFPLAHPAVASTIPGMGRPERVQQNLDLLRFPIPADLWADMKAQGLLHPAAPVPDAVLSESTGT